MTRKELSEYLSTISAPDRAAMDAAAKRQAQLAKPPGSLGKLEELSIRLAGLTGQLYNHAERCDVLVFAADNGVVAEGVSSAPQSVTLSQALNMTRHATGMSCMAHALGYGVRVYDVGINGEVPGGSAVVPCKVRYGTENLAVRPAMTEYDVLQAISVGIAAAEQAKEDKLDAIGIGEMGIGNTTTSTAVLCALTGAEPVQVTGRGGGLTDKGYAKKLRVIERALALHQPNAADPIDVLAKVGGLDLAAMTGAYLGCAHAHLPAVADGLISVVAALCAVRLCENVRGAVFLSHASCEPGYRLAAEDLRLSPCLLLDMRLGEGSGCPLMFGILRAACAVMNRMATFSEASINDGYLDEIRRIDAFTPKKP